jgi:DNA-binding response OmpR family regulator
MSTSATILSAGRDDTLLSTRNAVLRAQGHTVVQAVTFGEIVEQFFAVKFDLIILCHSLPLEERRKVARLVQNHAPSTPVLTINAFEGQSEPAGVIQVHNRPQDIVDTVAQLVKAKP